jgi:oxygen-independent coproporphyrinogen-3 oxidase
MATGQSPALAREVLSAETRALERVLLEVRLHDGLDADVLDDSGRVAAAAMVDEGLIDPEPWHSGRVMLTRPGRLLADLVVRRLTGDAA